MNRQTSLYCQNPFNMTYDVYFPDEYRGLPLLVYLHGAGERGTEISHVYRHGVPKLIHEGQEIPAVVLCPQCPTWAVWDNVVSTVKAVIDHVAAQFAILPDRICITGSSMGGFGTWMMGKTYPNFFSAIGPVAGGGMSWRCSNLRTTPVYAIHGGADSCVPPIYSELMVNSVNAAGGKGKLLLLEGKEHNDGIDDAYRNTDLIPWLLSMRRTDFSIIPEFCCENF